MWYTNISKFAYITNICVYCTAVRICARFREIAKSITRSRGLQFTFVAFVKTHSYDTSYNCPSNPLLRTQLSIPFMNSFFIVTCQLVSI
jgi:hypothetical protein